MVAVEIVYIILIQVTTSRKLLDIWTWRLREVWAVPLDTPSLSSEPSDLRQGKGFLEKINLRKVYPHPIALAFWGVILSLRASLIRSPRSYFSKSWRLPETNAFIGTS